MNSHVPAPATKYCQTCGVVIDAMAVVCPKCGVIQPLPRGLDESDRKRVPALMLCFFFGIFGAHRFYAGKMWSGVAQILTLGGLGIWTTIDFIRLIIGDFRDAENRRIEEWI